MHLNATGIKRRIGKEINRRKNKLEAHVVDKNVYVTMVIDKLNQNQYSFITPQNAHFFK